MGMGEPLLNYANTLRSAERITAPDGLGMSAKRITVSTAGIAKMIRKLADDGTKFNLALSLHAANDAKRDRIMPINEQNSLTELKEALRYYTRSAGRPVTFEYILLRGFNDTLADAQELVKYASDVHAKVNLIHPDEKIDPLHVIGRRYFRYDLGAEKPRPPAGPAPSAPSRTG